MKRVLAIFLGLALLAVAVAPAMGQADTAQQHICCRNASCDEGLTALECCATGSELPLPPTTVQLDQVPQSAVVPGLTIVLPRHACEGHDKKQSDKEPDDKTELYLKIQHFLI